MNDGEPLVRLEKVTKRYPTPEGVEPLQVLRGIDLDLAAGRSLAVVGPSGLGKSTLLKVIGALDRPTSGRVLFDRRDLSSLDEDGLSGFRNRDVSFVCQMHHLLPQLTLMENVLVPTLADRSYAPREQPRERARRLLERVGLLPRAQYRPGRLSGGECQRAAVVRALIMGPRLLLGDEPEYIDENGRAFQVRLAGGIANSVLQGSLVIPGDAFLERFPSISGRRVFLVDAPRESAGALRRELERALCDFGVEVTPAAERLAAFNTVEHTYLRIFLALGGLGLALGSVGLGVIVFRNVLERRSELALLRAVGFSRRALISLVFREHWLLFAAGLVTGAVAAGVASLPAVLSLGTAAPYVTICLVLAGPAGSGSAWVYLATRLATAGGLLDALRREWRTARSGVERQVLLWYPSQRRVRAVLLGKYRFTVRRDRPFNGKVRVVPDDPALALRVVKVAALVEKLGLVAQDVEAVREAFRHEEHALVFGREHLPDPFPERGAAAADVHGHVEDLPRYHAHEFRLGVSQLVMQPPKDAGTG